MVKFPWRRKQAPPPLPSHRVLNAAGLPVLERADEFGSDPELSLAWTELTRPLEGRLPVVIGKECEFFETGFRKPHGVAVIDLAAHPVLTVTGSFASGKTTLLRDIALQLAARHSPEEVRFLILPATGLEGAEYGTLPHTLPHTRPLPPLFEWWRESLLYLRDEILRRRILFAELGVANIHQARTAGLSVPEIVVFADMGDVLIREDNPHAKICAKILLNAIDVGEEFGVRFVAAASYLNTHRATVGAFKFKPHSAHIAMSADTAGLGAMDVGGVKTSFQSYLTHANTVIALAPLIREKWGSE